MSTNHDSNARLKKNELKMKLHWCTSNSSLMKAKFCLLGGSIELRVTSTRVHVAKSITTKSAER